MATYEITAPSGEIYEITAPDDATEEQVLAYAKANMPAPADPSAGAGTLQVGPFDTGIPVPETVNRALAGAGKAFVDIARGTEQAGRAMVPGVSPREAALQQEIDESRRLDAPLLSTGAGMVGNIGGNIAAFAPTSLIPGAGTYTGATAAAGILGALQPVAEGESRALNSLMSAAGGTAGRATAGAVSRLLSPQTAPQATSLMREGVPLTPGQILGGTAHRTEDAATSIPFVGDAIRRARTRGIEAFNKAAINRALKPIGEQADEIGHEGLAKAHSLISSRFEEIAEPLIAKADKRFVREIRTLAKMADKLPEPQRSQFSKILQDDVIGKFSPNGAVPGKVLVEIDSELGRLSAGYRGSPDFDKRNLGHGLYKVQESLRSMVGRSNPDASSQLRRVRSAYAKLLRVEDAGGRTGAHEGVFTPAHLKAAARKLDRSLRKRKYAHGKALMQDLARSGQAILPSRVPDSGTPLRTLAGLGLLGGAHWVDPLAAAGMLGAAGVYTRPGQWAAQRLLSSRPPVFRAAGQGVRALYPYAGIGGAGLLTGYGQAQ